METRPTEKKNSHTNRPKRTRPPQLNHGRRWCGAGINSSHHHLMTLHGCGTIWIWGEKVSGA
jgi:hypothetical protein